VHVTLRVRPGVPSLRASKLVHAFERSMIRGCERGDFRVVQYSLQSNHVHLLVEAADARSLAQGMMAVGSRLARAAHRVFGRTGRVLADRYHARALKTPREVHRALRYVLLNARRHARRLTGPAALDPASSGRWFDGWLSGRVTGSVVGEAIGLPVARARTWLLRIGWQRHGFLDPAGVPGPS
jgi:REP element-mobilizing transposase RayT